MKHILQDGRIAVNDDTGPLDPSFVVLLGIFNMNDVWHVWAPDVNIAGFVLNSRPVGARAQPYGSLTMHPEARIEWAQYPCSYLRTLIGLAMRNVSEYSGSARILIDSVGVPIGILILFGF